MRLARAGVQPNDVVAEPACGILQCPQQNARHTLPSRRRHHVHPLDLTRAVGQALDATTTDRLAIAVTHEKCAFGWAEFGGARLGHVRREQVQTLVELAHFVDHRPDQRSAVGAINGDFPKVQLTGHESTCTESPAHMSTTADPLRCSHADAPPPRCPVVPILRRRPFRHCPARRLLLVVREGRGTAPRRGDAVEGVQRDHPEPAERAPSADRDRRDPRTAHRVAVRGPDQRAGRRCPGQRQHPLPGPDGWKASTSWWPTASCTARSPPAADFRTSGRLPTSTTSRRS